MNDTEYSWCNTQQFTQPPLARSLPLSRFTSQACGGSAFYLWPDMRQFDKWSIMKNQQKTLFDKFLSRIKNNPTAATVLVIGTIVIAVSTFTDAAQKILGIFVNEETHEVAGKWQTPVLANVYVESDRYVLLFEFMQQGDTLSGSITDMDEDGNNPLTRNILDGKIKGNLISFYTQTDVKTDKGSQLMKEAYSGILNKNKDAISFSRLNDLPTGGVQETFVAKRK